MAIGTLYLGGVSSAWSSGCAAYEISREYESTRLPVAVREKIGGLPCDILALLDTGAEWSIIGGEIADELRMRLTGPAQTMILSRRTKLGWTDRARISPLLGTDSVRARPWRSTG